MYNAKNFLIQKPHCIDQKTLAIQTLSAMSSQDVEALCVTEDGAIISIITAKSILQALSKSKDISKLTAKDLSFDPCPTIKDDSSLINLLPKLNKYGALTVVDSSNSILGIITKSIVISAMIAHAEELEKELATAINCSSDELVMTDGEGRILRANAVFEDNFGVKVTSVIGKNVEELEENKIFFPSAARLAIESRDTQTVIQIHQDGRKLLATATPAFNKDNSIFRVIVNTRDVTRLSKLRQQLEEAELLKNEYKEELIKLHQDYMGRSDMVASSPAMLEIIRMAKKIAVADSTVLLTGESGSGKGIIAHYIHSCSKRSEKPFTVVNCGAIPENLIESELFGYVGGAFTSARKEGKIGKLELANEGTIFLDEIAELPFNLQVKLLHVIQEGIINRIGGTKDIRLNLRFIAATNRNIQSLVEEGKFREDLYFRLNVIPLNVPPLRERREDIKPLVEQIIDELSKRYGQHKYFSAEAYKCLENYHWPGNVRELQNLVERMMIVIDSDEIGINNLPRHLLEPCTETTNKSINYTTLQPLKNAREEMERQIFSEALRTYHTTYEIAKILEIDQSTVVRKLQKYGLKTSHINPAST